MWRWFQKAYDNIDSWDYSPEMKKTVQAISDKIPDVIAKALIGYIKVQYMKSEELAKASLQAVKVKLDEVIKETIK